MANKRQKIGYQLTLTGLFMLISGFAMSPLFTHDISLKQAIIGLLITLLPLLAYMPRAIKRESRAYQVLALMAPIYLLFGGIIWLWRDAYFGLWFCLAASLLEVGTILHNFQRRKRKTTNLS
ncbi:hypothetical protein [Suttonella ornithocola]|uniref:Inner membrane protein n=1 Tax=Suttonella ornithocola TaxID=279832 RepID=A0A380MT43_9GAMM|nr:hypothetical protein [Suttonella ornithocola]SUO95750.1 Uncharacterised protein [Suttonella ornithocola]